MSLKIHIKLVLVGHFLLSTVWCFLYLLLKNIHGSLTFSKTPFIFKPIYLQQGLVFPRQTLLKIIINFIYEPLSRLHFVCPFVRPSLMCRDSSSAMAYCNLFALILFTSQRAVPRSRQRGLGAPAASIANVIVVSRPRPSLVPRN